MKTELYYLVAASTWTAILWMPYIVDRLLAGPGLLHEVGYPQEETKLHPWAARLKKAHLNSVENLVVFAPLVLAAHVAGVSTQATVWAAMIFFWARIAHTLSYTFAIPWVRTLAFSVGFGCQATFAVVLLMR